jgi:uncharacterized iron-regulated membrane protein
LKKRTKRTFSWHHWCGLLAGIFILILSLTGSVLVFHDEIDETVFENLQKLEQPASHLVLVNSYETVRKSNPGWDIRIPELKPEKDKALKYELRKELKRKWLFVHPESGLVLNTIDRADNRFTQILLEIHYTLFAETLGKTAVLLTGICFLILTITGLMLYRKSLVKVLTFRQKVSFKSRRSFYSSLHRIIGVWSLIFNLLISASGICLAVKVVNGAFKSKNPKIEVPAFTRSPDELLDLVQKEYPTFEMHYLRFPVKLDGNLTIRGRLQDDPAIFGNIYSTLEIKPQTGKITKVNFLRDQVWYEKSITILSYLHFGEFGGLFLKFFYCFFGLLPGVLSISGFLIWRYRRAKVDRIVPAKVTI